MARPSTEIIKKKEIIKQFKSLGIKSIINLQKPGEHASCGSPLESSGFTYDPQIFMENSIYFYNFAWKDYGEASMNSLLDMVKVMAFALTEGKVAVHCHAGLGRTGVLIACYLVYSLRVKANDAIRFVRLKRPNAVQTRGQILCVQEFEQFILPHCIVFCNKEYIKDKKCVEFSLSQYLNKQKVMLHGYEARALRYIPKIIFVLCERILRLCNCEIVTSCCSSISLPFTKHFIVAQLNLDHRSGVIQSHAVSTASPESLSSPSNSPFASTFMLSVPSTATSRKFSAEVSERHYDLPTKGKADADDDDATTPHTASCTSPEMSSCASGLSGLDDNCLDAFLADGIHAQILQDNSCFQELSSHLDWQKTLDTEKFKPCPLEDVVQALLTDHNALSDGMKKYIRNFRIELNEKQSAWTRLLVEKNLYVLTALLFDWLEHLRVPILCRDDLSYVVILANHPEACLRKLDVASQYVIEYILRFIARLHPLSRENQISIIKRFVASFTHQAVPIHGSLRPAGKGFHKLREGTHRKVMEFMSLLFDMVSHSIRAIHVFPQHSTSQQTIGSSDAAEDEEEETDSLKTP